MQRSAAVPVSVVTSQASGLVATPYAQTVTQGGAASFSVAPILTNGFTGTISLSCSPPSSLCPSSVTFNPPSFSTVVGSTMTVTTTANTPPGVYTISVSGTSPGQSPVSTSVVLTVSITPGGPVTITNSPSSSTFWVDGVAYPGYASFVPQPGGDTLTVTQTQPPPTGPGDHYQFSPDGGLTTQVAFAPRQGQSGGNGCSWTCSNGSCGSSVPIASPQPAPKIQNVTDASGDNPAVLYPGVPVQITVNGSNFGGATGYLNFCRPGGSPCDFTSNGGLSEQIISWNPYQIVATVTLPTDAPVGGWLVYVSAMFWISGADYLNPSMGNLDVGAPPPGPAYLLVLHDATDTCSGCFGNARRTFTFQVTFASGQPWSGPIGAGGSVCEIIQSRGTTSCTPGLYASISSCNGDPGQFAATGTDGTFVDVWTFGQHSLTPAGCGYSVSDLWNAIAGAPPNYLTPVGLLAGFLHTDAIQINGTTATPGTSGQLTGKCINSTDTIPCPH